MAVALLRANTVPVVQTAALLLDVVSNETKLPTTAHLPNLVVVLNKDDHNLKAPHMRTALTITLPTAANALLGQNASGTVSKLIAEADAEAIRKHLSTRRTSCTLSPAAARRLAELEQEIGEPAPTIVRALVELAVANSTPDA